MATATTETHTYVHTLSLHGALPIARAVECGSAEQRAIDGGRSEALAQALRTVADADLGAGPKYAPPVVRDLTRTISARAYGLPLLEDRKSTRLNSSH